MQRLLAGLAMAGLAHSAFAAPIKAAPAAKTPVENVRLTEEAVLVAPAWTGLVVEITKLEAEHAMADEAAIARLTAQETAAS